MTIVETVADLNTLVVSIPRLVTMTQLLAVMAVDVSLTMRAETAAVLKLLVV